MECWWSDWEDKRMKHEPEEITDAETSW